MINQKSGFTLAGAILAGTVLLTSPLSNTFAGEASGSDFAFNEMVSEMAGRDTGSLWFDYYVEGLNQQIALQSVEEPYGAAGPSGPLTGFNGYVAGFTGLDTGSMWFNTYVENVRGVLKSKGY